jgi:hypothetical protein
VTHKCAHRRVYDGAGPISITDGPTPRLGTLGLRWCMDCEERLPIGLANDTPVVLVDVRAAELSDLASSHADHMESAGWSAWTHDGPPLRDDRWHAGWLGKAIFEHDREQMTAASAASAALTDADFARMGLPTPEKPR